MGSWDKFLCSCKAKHKGGVDQPELGKRHTGTVVLYSGSHLPVLVQLEEGLVLSGPQHQEVDEQEHAKRIRVWIQTEKKKQTADGKLLSKTLKFKQLTKYRDSKIYIFSI